MRPVTIIGSGPAGLALAYFLSERKVPCTIISADDGPGGLARPITFAGRRVDPGPHSFYASYDHASFELLNACFSREELRTFIPRRAVRTDRFIMHTPWRACDLAQPKLLADAARITWQRRTASPVRAASSVTARERVLRTRGRRFFDVFFEPWCRKHFGIGAELLDGSLADLLAAERRSGAAGHIVHPHRGAIGDLWTRLAEKLHARDVEFRWGSKVQGFELRDGAVRGLLVNGTTMPVDGPVFSAAPLHVTAAWLGLNVPAAPRRSTILVFAEVERYNTDALYLTDHRVDEPLGRITFVDNWNSPRSYGSSHIICAEFWCSPGDHVHGRSAEALLDHVGRYLERNKLGGLKANGEHVVKGPLPTTPVPLLGEQARMAQATSSIAAVCDVQGIGRHAGHRWDGVDDAIREARSWARDHADT